MEEVYSRTWHIEKGRGSRKHKESCKEIWGKNEYWSKIARKVGYDGGKGL